MFEKRLKNRMVLKSKFAKREKVFGGWVSFREPAIAETFARIGFDFVAIDMEHTTISIDDANRIITSVQSENSVCLPRQVSHNNDYMKPLLEAGCDGVMFPMVNSEEDVKLILNNFKFPPLGKRSFGVNRAHGYGLEFDKYISTWNDSGLLIIQIESMAAVENIEEILKIKEIDAVMVGPYDISGSLDVPGQTAHPEVRKACRKVIEACERTEISCVTQIAEANADNIKDSFEQGFTSVILGSDLFIISNWAKEMRILMDKMY